MVGKRTGICVFSVHPSVLITMPPPPPKQQTKPEEALPRRKIPFLAYLPGICHATSYYRLTSTPTFRKRKRLAISSGMAPNGTGCAASSTRGGHGQIKRKCLQSLCQPTSPPPPPPDTLAYYGLGGRTKTRETTQHSTAQNYQRY